MEFTGSAAASFSAHHLIEGHPRCGRDHGHRWRIEVEIRAGQDPATGELVGHPQLADAVERLAAEFHRESLNDMLPASPPTAAGLALFTRERLAMAFTNVVSVTVRMDEEAVTLHA